MMKYCMECGTKLTERFLKNEGMIPYCENCQAYRFPVFSTAVSMEVQNPSKDKILLIKQYGKDRYVLVAGYVNLGESAEHTVAREVKEEIGLDVREISFEKSEYFPETNTLMLNFSCVAETEDLVQPKRSGRTDCQKKSGRKISASFFIEAQRGGIRTFRTGTSYTEKKQGIR